ncbi:ABC transporter permease [Cellulomonas aerilata]|uniref:ABC transporter permease n=1 Tax=Cellulomonas aerilata TaxID=515326 RepID=A0A512DHX4_9CELL|nr:ABC transporter permease [Cellulomonas aerilata]GEO35820.1 ABC transporter permease [Cellulomonas aerilata]
MLRLTLAQMRRSLGRLTAAGVAIAIGTAFVAATLIAGAVITRTSLDAVSASYADADLVVTTPGEDLTEPDLAALRRVDGVRAVDGRSGLWVELTAGSRRVVTATTAVASDPRLEAQAVLDGAFPAAPGEVALPGPVAERLGVGLGDEVTAQRGAWVPADAPDAEWVERPEPLTVVGLTDDPAGAFAQSGGAAVLSADDARRWTAQDAVDGEPSYDDALLVLADGTDPAGTLPAVASAVSSAVPGAEVRTKDDQARAMTAELTDGTDVFTMIVLGFAAVALLVAALVISNTFQVMIAQRTRTLALLRCVGADRRQLRRSVLLEAGLLGVASSTVGVVLGVVVAQVALWALGGLALDVPLPSAVTVTPAVVLVPLLVGTLVTVLASLAPARAATRVAPLAALRPADAPAVTHRGSRPRLVLAVLLTLVGSALLALGVVAGRVVDPVAALGLGVLGGALSFVGVLVGTVFWVPRVVGSCGRLVGRSGTSARLAAANTVRNPRRTAATSTALLIGVTLVTMMSTGAASARVTLAGQLDEEFPVDVQITAGGGALDLVTPTLVRAVEGVDGVEQVVTVPSVPLVVGAGAPAHGDVGTTLSTTAWVLEPSVATGLVRTPSVVDGLADGTVVVGETLAQDLGVVSGDSLTLSVQGADGSPTGEPTARTVVVTALSGLVLTPSTAAALPLEAAGASADGSAVDPAGGTLDEAWVRLSPDADPAVVVPAVQDELSEIAVQVVGAAVERAMYEGIIDTLLAVVVGLLAVAVVIALIGVANTLSLSVIERRRESATLRVIGLSRRRLRASLAIEGVLIAGVGGALGVLLGVLYGWAGAATVLGVVGDVHLDVPWVDLAAVLAVSLAAGLLASVLPGRSAARTSPVAALAVD